MAILLSAGRFLERVYRNSHEKITDQEGIVTIVYLQNRKRVRVKKRQKERTICKTSRPASSGSCVSGVRLDGLSRGRGGLDVASLRLLHWRDST